MMKKWFLMFIVILTLVLTSCGNTDDSNSGKDNNSLQEVKVEFLTDENVKSTINLQLSVQVTQNKKSIENATLMDFEVWQSGYRSKGVMVTGKHSIDGIYKATVKVKNNAVYYVFAHTEANGLHVMPKKKFIIGNPNMAKVKAE